MNEEELRKLTYEKRLLTDQEIQIILMFCVEQMKQKEIAEKLAITDGTLRRYLSNIREKFSQDLCNYAYQLKDTKLTLSNLWLRTSDYHSMKNLISTCQQKEDTSDLDNDSLDEILENQ